MDIEVLGVVRMHFMAETVGAWLMKRGAEIIGRSLRPKYTRGARPSLQSCAVVQLRRASFVISSVIS